MNHSMEIPRKMADAQIEARHFRRQAERGIMLVEAIVYLAVLMLIFGLAIVLLHRSVAHNAALTRQAEAIVRAVQAGERWRADVRLAAAPLRMETINDFTLNYIPQADMEVAYGFGEQNVWRCTSINTNWAPVLTGVKAARTIQHTNHGVVGYRWEIELAAFQKTARLKPLFTFQAVPERIGNTPAADENK